MLFWKMNLMKSSDLLKCVNVLKMKSEVSIQVGVTSAYFVSSTDLHAEMSRQNKKKAPAATDQTSTTLPSVYSTPSAPSTTLEPSPLIKANPSPEGTPMHTTFVGTQNFTPSTRISALNMVGDLLRKVGVSRIFIDPSLVFVCQISIAGTRVTIGTV